ncbi:alpha-(1,6)-fucosyltransferase-like isoform X1 [Dermacentor andersoni]|uniref:alpha-(1,6)-fucosyltransferase-like isoform X1 n=1 Tax=Dermacentor andersoni TaxID=34620 RepID=UPI003B3A93EE
MYAILPLEPEPSVWSRLRRLAEPTTSPQDLVSSVRFAPGGRLVGFRSTAALYNHAQSSVQELQRFLSHQLRLVAARVPQALRRRIAALSVAAKERLRHLAAEVKTMAHETGILKRKRQALFQLKSKGVSQGRPVLVDSQPWHYAPSAWHEAFLPLSSACPSRIEPRSQWPGENLSANRAALLELPRDVADALVRLHGDPYAWWFGQLMAYIMRPSKRLLELITQAKRKLQFQSPIVGLHVRRTDKESEASFHESEEYMEHAEAFFAAVGPHVPRRVFVATDEPDVFHELRHRYPNYSFVGDEAASAAAREQRTRYSLRSLLPLARDALLLAECDLVVCTLSSGVCRVVYELMQARRTDASAQLVSLDVDYFYAFVQFPARRVIYSHRPLHPKELWLREGDAVERLGDHSVIGEARRKKFLDGVSVGALPGTVLTGLYPTYKSVPQLRVAASKLTSWT